MTKDLISLCLGVVGDYMRWERQTDPQKDISTNRLNRPLGQFIENGAYQV